MGIVTLPLSRVPSARGARHRALELSLRDRLALLDQDRGGTLLSGSSADFGKLIVGETEVRRGCEVCRCQGRVRPLSEHEHGR